MIEGGKPTAQSHVPAFYLSVDGKEYGPFASKHEEEVRAMYNRYKGITPRYATVKPSELVPVCKKVAPKKKEHPGLF